jgi:GntR family transcriptional regulator
MQNFILNRADPLPLYAQLKEGLRSWIEQGLEDGSLAQNDQIPPEYELAECFQVSRITVKRALDDLVAEGLVYSRQGKGTFIAGRKVDHDLGLFSHTIMMEKLGLVPSSRVLEAVLIPAPAKVAHFLEIKEGNEVVKLARLRLGNEEPLSVSITYLPHYLVPNLLRYDLTGSLLALLKQNYGHKLIRCREFIEPVYLPAWEAQHLGLAISSLGLLSETINYLTRNTPIEYTQSVIRGDKARLTIEHSL